MVSELNFSTFHERLWFSLSSRSCSDFLLWCTITWKKLVKYWFSIFQVIYILYAICWWIHFFSHYFSFETWCSSSVIWICFNFVYCISLKSGMRFNFNVSVFLLGYSILKTWYVLFLSPQYCKFSNKIIWSAAFGI